MTTDLQEQLIHFLFDIETWEANLLNDGSAWDKAGYPVMSDAHYDDWLKFQGTRNQLLKQIYKPFPECKPLQGKTVFYVDRDGKRGTAFMFSNEWKDELGYGILLDVVKWRYVNDN